MSSPRLFDRKKIATILLEAVELGLPMADTVMALMEVDLIQARYMIRVVREKGYLGIPGHRPTRALVHRGSVNQKAWAVCESCLVTWPCPEAFPDGEPQPQRRKRGKKANEPARKRARRPAPA